MPNDDSLSAILSSMGSQQATPPVGPQAPWWITDKNRILKAVQDPSLLSQILGAIAGVVDPFPAITALEQGGKSAFRFEGKIISGLSHENILSKMGRLAEKGDPWADRFHSAAIGGDPSLEYGYALGKKFFERPEDLLYFLSEKTPRP